MIRFFKVCAALIAAGSTALGYTNVLDNGASQTITNGWDAGAEITVGTTTSNNIMRIISGGSVTNGTAYIGRQAGASNNVVIVDGPSAEWMNSGNLYVGYSTESGNALVVTNGATVTASGFYLRGSNNTAAVEAGSWLLVGEGADKAFLAAGGVMVSSSNATLSVAAGSTLSVGGDMRVENGNVAGAGTIQFADGVANTLTITGQNSAISTDILFRGGTGVGEDKVAITDSALFVSTNLSSRFEDFETLAMTNSVLGGSGTVDGFADIMMTGGRIAPDGNLILDGVFTPDGTVLELTAGFGLLSLTNSGGAVDLGNLAALVTIPDSADPTNFTPTILTSADGLTGDFAATTVLKPFLLYNFSLTNNAGAGTVSVQSEAVQDGELGASLAYSGIQGIRASFNGMLNRTFVRTKQLRRNAVATDNAISDKAYLIYGTNAPAGPQGPGERNTIFGMNFWMDHFNGQGDYDAMGISEGFELNNNGTSFGLDRLFGEDLVAGINYTYARSDSRATGGDQMNTETYRLALYGEWFTKSDYYLEGLLGLAWTEYDSTRITAGYEGTGNFKGTDVGGHLEVGKYLHRGNWAMAPYGGLSYLGIKSDQYAETAKSGGNTVIVSEQKVASLESALGLKLRNRMDTRVGRFQTMGYAEWVYDFLNEDIESTLTGNGLSVKTARITPGEQLLNAGLGLSWLVSEHVEIGVSYDGRFNEGYEEHIGSALLGLRF